MNPAATQPGNAAMPDDPLATITRELSDQLLELETAAIDRDPDALQRYSDAFALAVETLSAEVEPLLNTSAPDVRERIAERVVALQQQMQRVFAVVSLRAAQTHTTLDALRDVGARSNSSPQYDAAGHTGARGLPSRVLGHA